MMKMTIPRDISPKAKCHAPKLILAAVLGLLVGSHHIALAGEAAESFFQGKQIVVYVGYGPGGSYDTCARLVARHMGRFIPGNPKMIAENRPGAGSITLANQMYATMPRDGTAMGTIGDVLLIKQILGEPGISFVSKEFNWIGRLDMTDGIFVVRPESGISSIDDARKKTISVGVPGAGSATALDVAVLNRLLGTKFKQVSGYNGSTEIKLALERGEIEGAGSTSWRIDREWVTRNGFRVLYQKTPEDDVLPNFPEFRKLGRNEDENEILQFFNSQVDIARSFLMPPDVPKDRAAMIRAAFMRMTKDPTVRAEAEKLNLNLAVLSGDDLQKVVEETSAIPERLRLKALEVSKASGG
jgi:tripartite-type tricarboxylate transporter receptor subunit TctC